MIANASHPRSQTHRETSPETETEAEAATEAATERLINYPRGSFSPHRSVGDARGSGDVVVSATRLDAAPDLTTIEHLDFDPDVPCDNPAEGPGHGCPHGNTADYIIAARLPCIRVQRAGICRTCWVGCKSALLYCCATHDTIVSRDEALQIVEVLR